MITLDVKNAIMTASWQIILNEVRKRKMIPSLITIIASYLSDRHIILETEHTTKSLKITSGVPQGSVLGPTLWIRNDNLFDMEMP